MHPQVPAEGVDGQGAAGGDEPHARVVDPAHFEGLWKRTPVKNVVPISQPLAVLGRSLDDYAAVIGGAP